MRTIIYYLLLLYSGQKIYSNELPESKPLNWQIQFKYVRQYNYRLARLPASVIASPANTTLPSKLAYLDTGHIATYTNLIGLMVQRKIWKFIHLQTGLTMSRRGYLGSYVKYSNHNEIHLIPRKIIFLPIIINLNFVVRKKILLEFGFGRERSIFFLKEKVYWPTTLENSSKGFFGYQWVKSRNLDQQTKVEIHEFGFAGSNYLLTLSIGYKFNKRTILGVNGNYSLRPKYYTVNSISGDPTLNHSYIYETKPYIIGLGATIAYAF
jgi:hypothetical protein